MTRSRWVLVAVALVAVAATVGGVALYASTTEDPGSRAGTPNAGPATALTSATAISQASPTASTSSPAPVVSPPVPALWQQPIASVSPLLTPEPVLNDAADAPTAAGLARALNLADPALAGDDVAMVVTDAASGTVLFNHDATDAVAPASTAKLAVAVAALTMLGPDHRFDTAVRQGSRPGEIVLVGGGDPTLAGPAAVGAQSPGYPTPASLAELAAKTAAQLHQQGTTTVALGYDASLFVGPQLAPGWKPVYQTEGDVAPVSALEVDEGSQDLTKPGRVANPAAAAAGQFAALLATYGITVTGVPRPDKAPTTPVTLAAVGSPPLYELVERMLGRSDNDLAEALARQVAIASGQPASFAGGVRAVKAALTSAGIATNGLTLVDASGLSPLDRATPMLLTQLLRIALVPAPDRTNLSAIITGLPIAGFYGTLGGRFVGPAAAGAGVIRAKTGTLNGVVSLAGYLADASGATLVFAVVVNGVKLNAAAVTEVALDSILASLPGCGCH
jgi:D-alanyl-D-alanine carboxypeptidase/D-alanyl-D-alanine-endopeptidase (penicillin-binding protein 4)